MQNTTELLNKLQREHINDAIRSLDSGAETQFADSTKYDLILSGRRYAPKRVAGIALERMTGLSFGPYSFKGGLESACFEALQRCGFTIAEKEMTNAESLGEDIAAVLALQTAYTSANTPQMEQRGLLIRRSIPNHIRANIFRLEPTFTKAGYSAQVEGSDGIGRKVESPWVRIYDEIMSPSATVGWYIVIHFSRNGRTMFVTAGCGATAFREGSLYHLPATELDDKVSWARDIVLEAGLPVENFLQAIQLEGNGLSRQFERATAFSKAFDGTRFSDPEFWDTVEVLSRVLVTLYEHERQGKSPLSPPPEVASAESEIEHAIVLRPKARAGQGRGLSFQERLAVEERAMELAHQALEDAGFSAIKDVHKTSSFDFSALRFGSEWAVEVKGTTSKAADSFLLTAAELKLHRLKQGLTALALVYDIALSRNGEEVSASGGIVELHSPWMVDDWLFEPTAYKASRTASPFSTGLNSRRDHRRP